MTTQNIAANPAPAPGAVAPSAPVANDSSAPSKSHASGSLYVGDLAPDVTEAFLFEIFNPVGPVSSIRVCRDSNTHQSLGYAYVNFHSADDAERALDSLNFCLIKSNPCRIMWSHRDPSIRKNSTANIFIKSLAKTIDNKQLYDTFSLFGSILSCKVAMDVTGASKGYGFVHYSDEAAAAKAIDEVNGKLIEGKKVSACKHERRQDRQSSSSGSKFTNLYVKMIPDEWNLQKFEEVFSAFGKITSCVLQIDEAGKHKGFGFVNYETHDDAVKAIDEGSQISVGEDKTLFVGRFQKKAERVASLSKKFEDLRREKNEKFKNLNLYVKNLEEDVNQTKLLELFKSFGDISSVVVMTDEKSVSRGFGFVCFVNSDDATKALTAMNAKMIGTKPIYVNRAQRKEDRRAQLENQFQQALASQRMQPMPAVFYGPPQAGMPMGGPMMYPMMGRRGPGLFPQQMRAGGYLPQQPFPPQQRPRNAAPRAYAGQRPGAQQKYRQGGPGARYPQQPMQVPNVAPPIAASMPAEMTASVLAHATPEMQKQMLGERLFPQVQKHQPELAGKITGMILEMEVSEILNVLENEGELIGKVNEAIEVLQTHIVEAQA